MWGVGNKYDESVRLAPSQVQIQQLTPAQKKLYPATNEPIPGPSSALTVRLLYMFCAFMFRFYFYFSNS